MKKFFLSNGFVDLTDIAGTLASVQSYIEAMEIEIDQSFDGEPCVAEPTPQEIIKKLKGKIALAKNQEKHLRITIENLREQDTFKNETIASQKSDIENLTAWNERLQTTLDKYKPIGE